MTTLPRRALGRTGLEVTSLSYGAMELRGTPAGPEVSDEQAERVLNATLDAGINFIDTAPDYGRSEERIGDRKSTRLNSSHSQISYAVFCLKKKKKKKKMKKYRYTISVTRHGCRH